MGGEYTWTRTSTSTNEGVRGPVVIPVSAIYEYCILLYSGVLEYSTSAMGDVFAHCAAWWAKRIDLDGEG